MNMHQIIMLLKITPFYFNLIWVKQLQKTDSFTGTDMIFAKKI